MHVLHTKKQIRMARRVLEAEGVSHVSSPLQRLQARIRGDQRIAVGDVLKSWDVRLTLDFLKSNLATDAPILDIGAYASEVLLALSSAGFSRLTGADLNPLLPQMPLAGTIRYEVADFMQTPFPPASFAAVTSISVIEHGFDGERLLAEVSRLLRPGGYFIASFDYWPDKIDTSGVRFFDMDWRIFSKNDVHDLLAIALRHGLEPVGQLSMDALERVIHCAGKAYTFAWLALERSSRQ